MFACAFLRANTIHLLTLHFPVRRSQGPVSLCPAPSRNCPLLIRHLCRHKCIPYTPGKVDQGDVNARLTRLEQIIEHALPQYSSYDFTGDMSVERSISMPPDSENKETIAGILDSLPNGNHNKWQPEGTPASNGAAPLFQQVRSTLHTAAQGTKLIVRADLKSHYARKSGRGHTQRPPA